MSEKERAKDRVTVFVRCARNEIEKKKELLVK